MGKYSHVSTVLTLCSHPSMFCPFPTYYNTHYTENTCLLWFVDCPHTHTHTASCWMHEQSKEGKLNYKCRSASNTGSHDTFLSVSQREAVISLAPDCMCVPTADTLFDETQCAVGCVCVCVRVAGSSAF